VLDVPLNAFDTTTLTFGVGGSVKDALDSCRIPRVNIAPAALLLVVHYAVVS
jgi:hypothetical protein